MVIDYKTHLASLIAVFLAIGMGILIGGLVMGGNSLPKSQRQLIHSLEGQFTQIRARNRELTTEITSLQAEIRLANRFAAAVVPGVVANRLAGENIAIVSAGQSIPPEIRQAVQEAGGTVASETVFQASNLSFGQTQAIGRLLGTGKDLNDIEIWNGLGQVLATGVLTGDPASLSALGQLHLFTLRGSYQNPVQAVVLLGSGPANQSTPLALAFLRAAIAAKATVVGVESSTTVQSTLPAFAEEGIATVDDVDLPAGQIALVYALGGEVGNWGVKSEARSGLLPSLAPGTAGGGAGAT